MLRVRLVGRPSLDIEGEERAWPTGRRAGEVLAWLALTPGLHARATMAPRFWPDVLDESARASLRTALHDLRRALGPAGAAHIDARRDAVALDDAAWVDVREMRHALDEGRPADALALGEGELLQGIEAEWVHPERERHRGLLDRALRSLGTEATAAGDMAAAIDLARRRVALDPLAEEPTRELMTLLAGGGERASAVAAYEALRERMARQLRVAPSPVTRALVAELRGAGAPPPVAAQTARPRLSRRLEDEARRTFVGRAPELATLGEMIARRGPETAVVFVSGPGGVGKTRLLRAALAAAPADVRTVTLDCGDVEPTPAGFLAALSEALGTPAREPGADLVADLVDADPRRTVIALDTYEVFGLMDAWLRRTFLPLLPERALTIVAGRQPPGAAWVTDPGWQGLVRELALGGLDEPAALDLLRARGLAQDHARRVNAFARGYPLALELAAAATRARPDLELAGPPPAEVVAGLVDALLEGLDHETVAAVRAASLLRRADESLLRELLGDEQARRAYEELRALPFCRSTPEGLVLHDVVRDAVARDFAHRDPGRVGELRRRATASVLAAAAGTAPRPWQTTADLLYLLENPAVRDAFFPDGVREVSVEPAAATDAPVIGRIAAAWESPEAAAAIGRWSALAPEAFSVARDADGAVTAFSLVIEHAALPPALVDDDPVVAAIAAHLESEPMAGGERALVLRRFLSAERGEEVCAPLAALFLDVKRLYMEMRPDLRRVYTAGIARDIPFLDTLGFVPLPDPVSLGGTRYWARVLDVGARSVDGWLAGLIDAEARSAQRAHGALGGVR